ncbi:hypothetical protein PoB_005088800 [Plakobranchus ocellatus]|uniref:Uncharacterized protein n=1 Tax=Plakobranchus ocellatus TaxID=259542 RepID=A0AAV4BXL2_9GAST|nr:hypothetical protein PoB_005088800 [Plakobranchus ocellatus]
MMPMLKRGGKALLQEGFNTGLDIARNVVAGENIKTAAKKGLRQAGKKSDGKSSCYHFKKKVSCSCTSSVSSEEEQEAGYKVKLTQASLYVRRCKINPAIVLAHEKALQSGTAKYHLKRVEVKAFSVGQGQLSFVEDNLFTAHIPKRVILGMVDSASFNGAYNKNPLHFKHNLISYLSLCVDGRQVPSKPLTPAFDKGLWARSYMSGTGTALKDKGFDISYEEYGKGFSLFCFDLTPTLTNGCSGEVELLKSGVVRLEARFCQALQQPIHVIVYAKRNGLIGIHRSREVLSDFTP